MSFENFTFDSIQQRLYKILAYSPGSILLCLLCDGITSLMPNINMTFMTTMAVKTTRSLVAHQMQTDFSTMANIFVDFMCRLQPT